MTVPSSNKGHAVGQAHVLNIATTSGDLEWPRNSMFHRLFARHTDDAGLLEVPTGTGKWEVLS